MMPFFLALEANNVGQILDLILAIFLIILVLQLDSGLVLDIGVESKPTLVIGGFLHTQDFVECDLCRVRNIENKNFPTIGTKYQDLSIRYKQRADVYP